MLLPISTVGRKIMVAITGQILVIFILFHISGNSSIFFHKLNVYVAALYTLPVFIWGGRIVLILSFILHMWYGIILKLENRSAKPQSYIVTNYRQATLAGRYQIWTGVIIAAFLIYHLLQFTFQVTNLQNAADTHLDALGRPDILMMVVRNFQQIGISGTYIISLAALGLHLLHGIQSSIQTWGLTNDRTLPVIEKTGTIASIILFFWYISIPVTIFLGILK